MSIFWYNTVVIVISMHKKVHPKIIQLTSQVTSKRAKAVIDFILKHGIVTTDDLKKIGYEHPPRAVRDVRENGIPIETIRVKGLNGKSIAAYTFGDPEKIQGFKLGGRRVFSRAFKLELYKLQDSKCSICNEPYDERFLQIDHRIPYEFFGDTRGDLSPKHFMLLCATCNKKKDRATETGCKITCFKTQDVKIMMSCFWASPDNYTHICMEPIRRIDLAWKGKSQVRVYEKLKKLAGHQGIELQDYIKLVLQKSI